MSGIFSKKKEDKPKPNCIEKENFIIKTENNVSLTINCVGCVHRSSVEDAECRERIIDKLIGVPVNIIVLDRGFYKKEYGPDETSMLRDVAGSSENIKLWKGNFWEKCGECGKDKENTVKDLKKFIKRDPVGAYLRAEETVNKTALQKHEKLPECRDCHRLFVENINHVKETLGQTKLVREAFDKKLLETIDVDFRTKEGEIIDIERDAYKFLFTPVIVPFFSSSRLISKPPAGAEILSEYDIENSKVKIYSIPGTGEELYFIIPPEYRIKYELKKLEILKGAHDKLLEEAPRIIESQDEKNAGEHFKILCKNEIINSAAEKRVLLPSNEINEMVDMLVRCMMGIDVVEIMLKDPNLQDVYINSPVEKNPVYVKHYKYDDCRTNVYLTDSATKNMVSKFRLKSGRAFSEISPIMDMELPEFGVRANITGPPISPDGYAFAFRRRSESLWTLIRFVENKMISPLAAGLLNFMVNEESTMLMCGDRGSGKTSMLTGIIASMPIKSRILTIEDTFEIPVSELQKEVNLRIQRMKVKPPTSGHDSFEMSAEDAMRSVLRMGDSAIIMGEVRGHEAKVLYEAMNIGGSGNCVLGTIHGKTARNLFERVVFSLGVPEQSFKATDLVVLATRIRPHGGREKLRRVIEISEVGKKWVNTDPEKIFRPLMKYDPVKDELEMQDTMENPEKSEVITVIAERWGTTQKNILEEIKCRGRIFKAVVDKYNELKEKNIDLKELLGIKTMMNINNSFTAIKEETENFAYSEIYNKWADWFKEYTDKLLKNKEETKKEETEELKETTKNGSTEIEITIIENKEEGTITETDKKKK